MMTVSRMILAGFISLTFVGELVFLSFAHAKDDLSMERQRYHDYDGPCISENNALALCQLSAKPLVVVITAERIAEAKSTSASKPSSPSPKKIFASVKANVEHGYGHHARRNPNAWRVYQTSFKPAPSAMPSDIHRLKDPFAANQKAKELLEKAPPVFKFIAACESRMKHYNEKTGSVLQGAITPGDIGLLQINSLVHAEDAFRDGFNIYSIYGNIGYAIKLYIEKGTQPWNSSKKCWGPKVPPQLQLPLSAQT